MGERDGGDGDAFGIGVVVGGLVTLFFAVIVVLLIWPHPAPVVVEVNENGIVCHQNRFYPNLNCVGIQAQMGPRLNSVEEKK